MAPKIPVLDKHNNAEFQVEKILSYSPIEEEKVEEDEYSCSSPSDSGFIICPIPKSKSNDNNKSKVKLFSEDDEITLLTEFAQFRSDHGIASDWVKFHSFMKDKLSNEFSKTQLSEKIRNFKKKFDNCLAKGDHIQFQSPHDASLFRISKTVWGNKVEVGAVKRKLGVEQENLPPLKKHKPIPPSPPQLKQQLRSEISKEEFDSLFPLLIKSFDEVEPCLFGRENCYVIGRDKGQELEDKFRELEAEEDRLRAKRYDLTLKELEKRNS